MSASPHRTLVLLTATALGVPLLSAPAPAHDVFVGCSNTAILRGDSATGEFQIIGACGGIVNSMTVHGDTMHIGDHNGNVYIRDNRTNSLTYAYTLPTDSNAIVRNASHVFVGGSDGKVYVVDPGTGAIEKTLDSFFSVDAMALKGNQLVVGSALGFVQMVDPDEGTFQFLFGGCGGCTGPVNSLARRGNELFMGDVNGNIYRYDFDVGSVGYSFTVASDANALAVDGDALLVGGSNGNVLRVDRTTGTVLATFEIGFDVQALAIGSAAGPGFPLCAGDGIDVDLLAECPCGNFGAEGHGCANSVNPAGALLTATGDANANTVVFTCTGVPNNALCTFLRGAGSTPTGTVFGDGVRCAAGITLRFGSQNAGQGSNPPNSVWASASPVASGNTRVYQLHYRNPGPGFCPTQLFNISNAYSIRW